MFDYYSVLMISTIIITCSWIFATIHKIWEECFPGYLVVTAFMLVLVLRTFNFNIVISWNEFYLYIVSFISIAIVLYSIWLRYLKKCK